MLKKIEDLANQVASREGCKIYDIEFSGGAQGRTLRVFIDKDLEGGASVDDCANVSKGLNLLLDVDDVIPGGRYNLEISTPGVERPLKKKWHYESSIGKKIWIRVNRSLESFGVQNKKFSSAKQLTENLKGCSDQGIHFELENESIEIPFTAIEKAHVVFEFEAEKGVKKNFSKLHNQSKRG